MLLSLSNSKTVSWGYLRRNFKSGCRNGELAPTKRFLSVCRTSWLSGSIKRGPAAGIWWNMLMMVATICSVSPFFDITAKTEARIRKGANQLNSPAGSSENHPSHFVEWSPSWVCIMFSNNSCNCCLKCSHSISLKLDGNNWTRYERRRAPLRLMFL